MKRMYHIPSIRLRRIVGQERLLGNSIKMSNEKVTNTQDIGFVKENRNEGSYNVWDDDWSK